MRLSPLFLPLTLASLLSDASRAFSSIAVCVEEEAESYDYVIVGGGSAGCVLAARLSEDAATTVLLIEAGDDPLAIARSPWFAPLLQETQMNWRFKSEPQDNTGNSFTEKRIAYPQGKGLGGSSSINFMVYHRGHPQDYDDWEALGNPGWNFSSVLPYFIKAEGTAWTDFEGPSRTPYRGHNGRLITTGTAKSGVTGAFLEAAAAAGHAIIDDYNNPETPTGAAYGQQTVSFGRRQSTFQTYLLPALNRPNLVVWRNRYVKRVKVKQQGGSLVAKGVEFVLLNETNCVRSVFANKEVIISAGALQSPKILQLSGIGKPEDLDPFPTIKQIKNLPVGRNLRDHVLLNVPFTYSIPPSDPESPTPPDLQEALKLLVYPTESTMVDGQVHIRTGLTPSRPQADIQVQLAIPGILGILQLPLILHYKELDAFMTYYGVIQGKPTVIINTILLNSQNAGTVKLSSATDVLAPPLIDPKLLESQADADTLAEGIRKTLAIVNASPLKQAFNFTPSELPVHVCHTFTPLFSDDYINCIIAQRADTAYHPTSTCRMGQSEADSVVDSNLKVHGFSNLRVVDASVFPSPVSGNTNAVVIMVAEKAADVIKASRWLEQFRLREDTRAVHITERHETFN